MGVSKLVGSVQTRLIDVILSLTVLNSSDFLLFLCIIKVEDHYSNRDLDRDSNLNSNLPVGTRATRK